MPKYVDIEPIIKKAEYTNRFVVSVDLLKDFPAADVVERKPGEWIGVPGAYFKCSKCYEGSVTITHFCPHCGADMRNNGNG